MSTWSGACNARSLAGNEGELVSVRITIEPRLLEELLEALAGVAFPINPQIYHNAVTTVEFPAYTGRLEEVRTTLKRHGFADSCLRAVPMMEYILKKSA